MKALRFLLIAFACLFFSPAYASTTLLPNGMQCFTDANGPIVSGSLNMFYPATSNPKPTWQDSNQSALNSQPIQLDGNGCATIYGIGSYRQQLFDGPVVGGVTTGNLIWDKITTDTSAYNAVFWAGLSGGTPNAITVTDPGFNGTDGTVINFTALSTNTAATTINPSGFGNISVVKDTASGPISLAGGEIIQNNIISVVYSASGNNFHLLNTAIATASGNTAPLCGANNLKITNDSVTPNTILTITADTVLMVNPSGQVINRTNISQGVNISTGTATTTVGGMDGESPGTSAWIYIWLIDNGSAPGALATAAAGNGLTPNMPSGYVYKCRLGAMRVDGAGVLMRTRQAGKTSQYVVTTATNTATLPLIKDGSVGSVNVPTYISFSLADFVPPTAGAWMGVVASLNNGSNSALVAPNGNYGSIATTGNPPPVMFNVTGAGTAVPFRFIIETMNVFYASGSANGGLFAQGWEDQVNAN